MYLRREFNCAAHRVETTVLYERRSRRAELWWRRIFVLSSLDAELVLGIGMSRPSFCAYSHHGLDDLSGPFKLYVVSVLSHMKRVALRVTLKLANFRQKSFAGGFGASHSAFHFTID